MQDTNSIYGLLKEGAEKYAGKTAVLYDTFAGSYEKLFRDVTNKAIHLQHFEGKRVALYGPSSYRWIVNLFGIILAGKDVVLVDSFLPHKERESLLATAESEGLDRREVLFAHKPAAVTQEDRREAIAALLRISEDSLTPEAINDTLTGCGIRARAEEKADGSLRVVFPRTAGVPAEFDQIRKIILDILPCHLEVEFYFRYLTWAECEAAEYTWDEVETAQHTWESFQMAVPPEE